jgi:hypothetical protein
LYLKQNVPNASARVQFVIMHAAVVRTSRVLEHWQVIFVKEHRAAGTVCTKQLICNFINHGSLARGVFQKQHTPHGDIREIS